MINVISFTLCFGSALFCIGLTITAYLEELPVWPTLLILSFVPFSLALINIPFILEYIK